MNLNRIPEALKSDILDMQKLYELTERMKNNDKYYYWERQRRSNLFFKTLPFRATLDGNLTEIEKVIFYLRYVAKKPIKEVVEATGYSKRMIQYKLNDIIIKLEEGTVFFKYIKKNKMQQQFIKEYVAYNKSKKCNKF